MSLEVQGGDYAPDAYAAWIDYDQDEVFEASEKLGEFVTSSGNETGIILFTVPESSLLGTTRMRVRGVYLNTNEPDPVDPCFSYGFGETEDYGVNIEINTGIGAMAGSTVSLYPNPTNGIVHLDLGSTGSVMVDVFDAQGRSILHDQQRTDHLTLDLAGAASGAYMIRVQREEVISTHRVDLIQMN